MYLLPGPQGPRIYTDFRLNTEAEADAIRAEGVVAGGAAAVDIAEGGRVGRNRRTLPPRARRPCAVLQIFNTACVICENRVSFALVLINSCRCSQPVLRN